MSEAPDEEPVRGGPRLLPRWMNGWVLIVLAPAFAILGGLACVAAVVLAGLVVSGLRPLSWLPGIAGLFGFGAICLVLYRGAYHRTLDSDAPTGAPPDRLFQVSLLARGGWLRQRLEPTTNAFLVIGDDGIRLRYRRPMNMSHLSLGFVFLQLAPLLKHVGITIPLHLRYLPAIGLAACGLLGFASFFRRHDHRFPWTGVSSVSAGANRFHVLLDDEEWPDGFLIEVHERLRARVAELFAARTLFHDEVA